MDCELEQMNIEGLSPEIKTLKDVRRYDKKTLVCPGGCGSQILLSEIAGHECVAFLKRQLSTMEDNLSELESRVGEMVAMEAYYKQKLSSLENKIEQMTEEMKVLFLERTRRDEIFSSKEIFYKEQTAALKEQVSKLEKRLHDGRSLPSKRPSCADEEDEHDIQRVEKAWALRYDKLLAEKITMETLYQRKDRQYQNDMTAMKQEVYALRDSLRLEREVMALEYDQANFEKLQSLIDQLEDLIREKRDPKEYSAGVEETSEHNFQNEQIDKEYICEGKNPEFHHVSDAQRRLPNSLGSIESEDGLILESQ